MNNQSSDLFALRLKLFALEQELGMSDLSEADCAVFAFIAKHKNAHIKKMMNHIYFSNISLGTINRSTKTLFLKGFIVKHPSTIDARISILSVAK